MTKSSLPVGGYSVNPYVGCTHALSLIHIQMCIRDRRKWKLWKEKEEKILRDSGVSEDIIEAIRLYDRQAFNSDRRYYERVQETGTYLDTVAASTDQAEPKTVQDFLDHIENQELYHVLITVDRLTPVSYTHLDVYKRQAYDWAIWKYGSCF